MIEKLLSLPANKLNVIVSHGHDDHLDEFFIQQHLAGATFFVPKFKTNGLSKRIERLTGRYPVELTDEAYYVDGVELRCFINPEFTEYDSIVTIISETDAVIHANDNWHEYPVALTDALNECLNAVPFENRYFFIQFGIADSFPVNYPSFDKQSANEMIESRFKSYQDATTATLNIWGSIRDTITRINRCINILSLGIDRRSMILRKIFCAEIQGRLFSVPPGLT